MLCIVIVVIVNLMRINKNFLYAINNSLFCRALMFMSLSHYVEKVTDFSLLHCNSYSKSKLKCMCLKMSNFSIEVEKINLPGQL